MFIDYHDLYWSKNYTGNKLSRIYSLHYIANNSYCYVVPSGALYRTLWGDKDPQVAELLTGEPDELTLSNLDYYIKYISSQIHFKDYTNIYYMAIGTNYHIVDIVDRDIWDDDRIANFCLSTAQGSIFKLKRQLQSLEDLQELKRVYYNSDYMLLLKSGKGRAFYV